MSGYETAWQKYAQGKFEPFRPTVEVTEAMKADYDELFRRADCVDFLRAEVRALQSRLKAALEGNGDG